MKLLISFLLVAAIGFGQAGIYKLVPGTQCSIVPPKGFVASTGFKGFYDSTSGASIMVTEIPTSFQIISKGFTADALKRKKKTLIKKETLNHNNSKATFIKVSQLSKGITYIEQILLFGDTRKTIFVNAAYPESHKELGTAIRRSLLSTTYNKR